MRIRVVYAIAVALLLGAPAMGRSDEFGPQAGHSGITIVDEGASPTGHRYTVQADDAVLPDLLRQLFAKTSEQYIIDQDVAGPATFRLKSATIEDILQQLSATQHLRITRDKQVVRVSRDTSGQTPVIGELGGPGTSRSIPGVVPNFGGSYGQLNAGNRLVSISVPQTQPITMAQAMARLSAQAGVPIRVDPRIADIEFSGTITQVPLSTVLQTVAGTAGLKVVGDATQATLVPADQFYLSMGQLQFGGSAAVPCRSCGFRLMPGWHFCPNCGQATGRGITVQPGRTTAPGTGGTRIQKIPRGG